MKKQNNKKSFGKKLVKGLQAFFGTLLFLLACWAFLVWRCGGLQYILGEPSMWFMSIILVFSAVVGYAVYLEE